MRRLFRRKHESGKKGGEEEVTAQPTSSIPQARPSQNTPSGRSSSNMPQAPAKDPIAQPSSSAQLSSSTQPSSLARPSSSTQPSSSASLQDSTSRNGPQANTHGIHICTDMCEKFMALPPDQHESILSQIRAKGGNPKEFKLTSFKITSAKWEGRRQMGSELEERRAIEGDTTLSNIPLASSTTYQYPPLPKGHARFIRLGAIGAHPLAFFGITFIRKSACLHCNIVLLGCQ